MVIADFVVVVTDLVVFVASSVVVATGSASLLVVLSVCVVCGLSVLCCSVQAEHSASSNITAKNSAAQRLNVGRNIAIPP